MQSTANMPVSTFEADAFAALQSVRKSLSDLIQSIGETIGRPIDLQRLLGLDSKLAWKVFNVINEADPLNAAKLVPGESSLKRLLQSASDRGVSEALCEAVRASIAEFDSVVERHAEDRTEFNFMASSAASPTAAAAAQLEYRQMSFRGDSHIWGVSTDVFCGTTIVRRSTENPDLTDECTLTVKHNARWLRSDVPTNIFAYQNYGADGPPENQTRLPLDAKAAERYGADLLPQFCSQPIPAFTTQPRPNGWMGVQVQSTEVGRRSAISLAFGHIFRRCPFASGPNGESLYHADIHLTSPIRLMLSYLLIHRPSFGQVKPSLSIFRSRSGQSHVEQLSSAELPMQETLRHMGVGKMAWRTPDLEQHHDMVQSAFNEIGWNPAEFDVYRVRIEYPVLHSAVRIAFNAQQPAE
jgi:hypothetical protein